MDEKERAELTRIADQRRAEAEAEYGQYVAAQDITFNGVLAYPQGAPVPVSNVKAHGYLTHGLVETAEAAAARRAEQAKAAAEAEQARQDEIDAQWQEATAQQEAPQSVQTGAATDDGEGGPAPGTDPSK